MTSGLTSKLHKSINDFCGKWLWINIADFGEEIDDEANTVLMGKAIQAFAGTVHGMTLIVNGRIPAEERLRLARALDLDKAGVPLLPVEAWHTSSELSNLDCYDGVIIQQNAPLLDDDLPHVQAFAARIADAKAKGLEAVRYISQGTFGSCMNTGGPGLRCARLLKDVADPGFRCCTESTTNLELTHRTARLLGDKTLRACQAGYVKKLLGRAPRSEFTRHLIGEPAPGVVDANRGANAQSTKSLFDATYREPIDSPVHGWSTLHLHPTWEKAHAAAKAYCVGVPHAGEPEDLTHALSFADIKRKQLGHTRLSQIDGLAKMQVAFHLLYGTPVEEIYYSSDPEWSSCDERGRFRDVFERICQVMSENPDVPWSPMYDPTCCLALIACLVGMGGDFFTDIGKADCDVDVSLLRLNTKSITFGDLLAGLRAPTSVEIQI